MRNAIISIVIFFSLLICVFFLNNAILNLCDDIKDKTNEIELELLNNKDIAYEKSKELLNFLNDHDLITSIYVNHQDFDTLKNETVKLCIYISHDSFTDAHASLNLIKTEAETVKHLQKPGIDNIL